MAINLAFDVLLLEFFLLHICSQKKCIRNYLFFQAAFIFLHNSEKMIFCFFLLLKDDFLFPFGFLKQLRKLSTIPEDLLSLPPEYKVPKNSSRDP